MNKTIRRTISRWGMLLIKIRNSSPSARITTPFSLTQSSKNPASPISTRSPDGRPYLSLILLKSSTLTASIPQDVYGSRLERHAPTSSLPYSSRYSPVKESRVSFSLQSFNALLPSVPIPPASLPPIRRFSVRYPPDSTGRRMAWSWLYRLLFHDKPAGDRNRFLFPAE